MNAKEGVLIGGNVFTYLFATIQANQIFQIIELCFSILTSIVIITLKVISWYKNAKKDGKIDKEEVDELINIIGDDKDGKQISRDDPKSKK